MLLDRLKAETRLAHDRIERDMDLTGRVASRSTYRALLARFHGFHAVWEPGAGAMVADPSFFHGRRKTPFLVRDLHALGASMAEIDALPPCRPMPPMRTRAAALGAMYVVEGSTLGGSVVAHHVGRVLGLGPDTGCAYFRSYGRDVGRMWKEFGAYLLARSSPADHDEMVGAANDTFECLRAWLRQEGSEAA